MGQRIEAEATARKKAEEEAADAQKAWQLAETKSEARKKLLEDLLDEKSKMETEAVLKQIEAEQRKRRAALYMGLGVRVLIISSCCVSVFSFSFRLAVRM